MTEHSRLFPPSGAYRWINCSASAEAVTHYPDVPSESGQEGTAWHFANEECLTKGLEPEAFLGRMIVARDGSVERRFVVTRDMLVDIRLMVDYVRALVKVPGESHVEARIDLSHFHLDCFGRCDVWHLGGDLLTVVEGKYGRVDVPVLLYDGSLNWQMVIYALGIIEELSRRLPRDRMPGRVQLVVVQPRSIQPGPRVKYHTVAVERVLALEGVVRIAIDRVLNAPKFVMGPWCEHCAALGACPPSREELRALAPALLSNEDMSPTDAGRILRHKTLIEKVIEKAQEVARENLLRGVPVPGRKLVTGVKHRQWSDEDAVADEASDVAGAFKVVSPAQMEKLPGGKSIVDRWARIPPGDPVVAPEADKRAPYVARSAEQMFSTGEIGNGN